MKKTMSLLIILTLFIALVGCGDKDTEKDDSTAKTESEVSTEQQLEREPTTEVSSETDAETESETQDKIDVPDVDYEDETEFEAQLNDGMDLVGKSVSFFVKEIAPDSAFGYNLMAGQHLNFCSEEDPGAEVGDLVYVTITECKSLLGSYILSYELLAVVDPESVGREAPVIYDLEKMEEYIETSWVQVPGNIVVTLNNTSSCALDLDVSVIYKQNGNVVDTASETVFDMPGGTTQMCIVGADDDLSFDDVTIQVITSEPFYTDCSADLSCEVSAGDKEDILVITNNGDKDVDYCYVDAFYYKDEQLVYAINEYVDEIKSGKFATDEIEYPGEYNEDTWEKEYYEFDRVEYVCHGLSMEY